MRNFIQLFIVNVMLLNELVCDHKSISYHYLIQNDIEKYIIMDKTNI